MAWPSNSDYGSVPWEHAFGVKVEDLKSKHKLHCGVPLLLAPTSGNIGEERFCLFDIMQGKSLVEFKFPGQYGRCEVCSHGWLILVNCYKVILYNLFSGKLIHLPPLETSISEYEFMIPKLIAFGKLNKTNIFRHPPRRGVLSGDANKDNFVLMVRHTSYVLPDGHFDNIDYNSGIKHMIAFIRSGDKDWTYKEWQGVEDIICINGLFYLLDRSGFLFSCEVNSDGYKLRQIPSHSLKNPSLVESPCESYLVESPEGDLLRVINKYMHEFMVYKLVLHDSKNAIWEEVANLGDVALFLGESHSISIKAPDFVGCQSNSIYYSRHFMHSLIMKPVRVQHLSVKPPLRPRFGYYFEGSAFIFSLNDKTIKSLYPPCHPNICQPLLWISPNIV